MRILYDHQTFTLQKYGGISRYFTRIISGFPETVKAEIAVKYSDNVYLHQSKGFEHAESLYNPFEEFAGGIKFRGKGRLFNFMKKIYPERYLDCETKNKNLSIEYLKKQNFDVFHPTYYDDYFLEYIGNKPFVLTIHDMIHELYPELLNDLPLSNKKAMLIPKANHIIAVSKQTKKDIIDLFNIPEEKISVIYHASSLNREKNNLFDLPENYFLFVGERGGYKNFLFFVEVMQSILKQRKNIYVICTGQKFNDNEIRFLTNYGVIDRFIHIFADDRNLYNLYNKSIALIFPSCYEGFGIPIIEAFEASCPVLLSNSSCFPEIAKDSALYFPPKNFKQMKECIESIIDNAGLRKSLVDRGNMRIKDFSWAKSAKQTLEVYKQVLNN